MDNRDLKSLRRYVLQKPRDSEIWTLLCLLQDTQWVYFSSNCLPKQVYFFFNCGLNFIYSFPSHEQCTWDSLSHLGFIFRIFCSQRLVQGEDHKHSCSSFRKLHLFLISLTESIGSNCWDSCWFNLSSLRQFISESYSRIPKVYFLCFILQSKELQRRGTKK